MNSSAVFSRSFHEKAFLGSCGTSCGSCWRTGVLLNIPRSLKRRGCTSRRPLVKQCANWVHMRFVCTMLDVAFQLDTHCTNDTRWFLSVNHRNSRLHGVVSSPPCPSTPSSWPTSAAAGPSTCSSSASRLTSRKFSVFPSARLVSQCRTSNATVSKETSMMTGWSSRSPCSVLNVWPVDRWGSCLLSPTWWWLLWSLSGVSWLTSYAPTKSCRPQMWENSWTVEVSDGKLEAKHSFILNTGNSWLDGLLAPPLCYTFCI